MHKVINLIKSVKQIIRGLRIFCNGHIIRKLSAELMELKLLEEVQAHNPGCSIDLGVILSGLHHGGVKFGIGTSLGRGTLVALGDEQNGWGHLEIGRSTWVGEYNNFRLSDGATISIGNDCLISQFCSLIATNHDISGHHLIKQQPPDGRKKGVCIGNGVWLGVGCSILPGVTIGDGAVIGANSVVVSDVPAFEIWAGLPARRVGVRGKVFPG